MANYRGILIVALLLLPGLTVSAVQSGNVPDTSTWYFHADLVEMRTSEAGKPLHGWLQREVFEEVREEAGIDLGREADSITAFAADESGTVVLLEGDISSDSKDRLMGLAAGAERLETLNHKGRTFYFAEGEHDGDIEVDAFDDGVYFSFALKNRIVATSEREQMEAILDSNGRIYRPKKKSGALVILSAEKNLIQAGMKADGFDSDEEGGWQSNILRNTEQIAFLIADVAGKIAVETQLTATQPEMAESLASIVRGLISLTMFSDDMDPEIVQFLQGTSVDVDGAKLRIKVAVDPEQVVAALDD